MSALSVLDRTWSFASVCILGGLLASCGLLHQISTRSATTPASASPDGRPAEEPVAVQQADVGGAARFVLCSSDCAKPTPKTLGPAPIVQSSLPTVPATAASQVVASQAPLKALERRTEPLRLSVRFDLHSAHLRDDQRRLLLRSASAIRNASAIRIEGRTDDLGSQGVNDRLSEARALAVMVFIRDEVLGSGDAERRPVLSASGKGLCCYASDNSTNDGKAANRRADITIQSPSERVATAPLSASPQ